MMLGDPFKNMRKLLGPFSVHFSEKPGTTLFVHHSPPIANEKLWRYMSFWKFCSMLSNGGFYWCRADRLEDKYEGTLSTGNRELRDQIDTQYQAANGHVNAVALYEALKEHTYLHCWSIAEYEDISLWDRYAEGKKWPYLGVAIETSYDRFSEQHNGVFCARVQYSDYTSAWIPEGASLNPFFHKQIYYRHEEEFRVIAQYPPQVDSDGSIYWTNEYPSGFFVKMDLQKMIERVIVSPRSPSWFQGVVKKLIQRYGYSFVIEKSAIQL